MKTITRKYKVYTFKELPVDTQDEAIDHLGDINVDHDWWDSIVDFDAPAIGLKITEFDTYRHEIKGKLAKSGIDVANNIINEHGEQCDTYKLAKEYQVDHASLERDEDDDVDSDEIDVEFERALLEEYLSMLRQEYDYLTGREAIIETIEANEYQFTIDGKIFS